MSICPKCAGWRLTLCFDQGMPYAYCDLCGYTRFLARPPSRSQETKPSRLVFPKKGTKLELVLSYVIKYGPLSTGTITEKIQQQGFDMDSNQVSTFLSVLKSRGLVRVVQDRRGILHGSLWGLTEEVERMA